MLSKARKTSPSGSCLSGVTAENALPLPLATFDLQDHYIQSIPTIQDLYSALQTHSSIRTAKRNGNYSLYRQMNPCHVSRIPLQASLI